MSSRPTKKAKTATGRSRNSAGSSSQGAARSKNKSTSQGKRQATSSLASSSASASKASAVSPSAVDPLVNCNDLFSYLEHQPRDIILALYADQQRGLFVAKTVLQKLPEMARQFVIRLAVCGGMFPFESMESWIADGGGGGTTTKKQFQINILERMEKLCVIEPILATIASSSSSPNKKKQKSHDAAASTSAEEPKLIVKLMPQFYSAIRASLTSLKSAPYQEVSPAELNQMQLKAKINAKNNPNTVPLSGYPTDPPSFEVLENFTQTRWDSVLHFLVGDKSHEDPPSAVIQFITDTGLMSKDSPGAEPEITSKGYEFMLHDVHVQVWQFVMQYLSVYKNTAKPKSYIEALLVLICLSYCKVGTAYPVAPLSKTSKKLMKDWVYLGLVYICQVGDEMLFYPTRAVVNLVIGGLADTEIANSSNSSNAAASESNATKATTIAALANSASATRALELALEAPTPSNSHIAIIVQTNFQVCAYTTSTVHVSMLGLFCDPRNFRRLPNVIFFRITREAVKRAFKLGIEAKQILRFLKMHAHPRMRTGDQPLIPTNVEDQIILWDRERRRVKFEEVYREECHSVEEFDECEEFAMENDLFAWSDRASRVIIVKFENSDKFITFVRKWRRDNHFRS